MDKVQAPHKCTDKCILKDIQVYATIWTDKTRSYVETMGLTVSCSSDCTCHFVDYELITIGKSVLVKLDPRFGSDDFPVRLQRNSKNCGFKLFAFQSREACNDHVWFNWSPKSLTNPILRHLIVQHDLRVSFKVHPYTNKAKGKRESDRPRIINTYHHLPLPLRKLSNLVQHLPESRRGLTVHQWRATQAWSTYQRWNMLSKKERVQAILDNSELYKYVTTHAHMRLVGYWIVSCLRSVAPESKSIWTTMILPFIQDDVDCSS
jgi:hypothetical protein